MFRIARLPIRKYACRVYNGCTNLPTLVHIVDYVIAIHELIYAALAEIINIRLDK